MSWPRWAERLPKVAPDPGRETAPVRPPPWCDGLKVEGSYSPGGIGRTIEAGQRYSNTRDEFINAAYQYQNTTAATVSYGESSTSEMCSFALYYTPYQHLDGCEQ